MKFRHCPATVSAPDPIYVGSGTRQGEAAQLQEQIFAQPLEHGSGKVDGDTGDQFSLVEGASQETGP